MNLTRISKMKLKIAGAVALVIAASAAAFYVDDGAMKFAIGVCLGEFIGSFKREIA